MKKRLVTIILLSTFLLNVNMVNNYVYAQDKESASQVQNAENSQDNSSEAETVDLKDLSTKEAAHAIAEKFVKEYGITGIQYAVMDNGNMILSDNAGVYSKKTNESINNDTMFGIGSISKMFTTASIMKLVDEGKVELDSPVTDYLPDFKMNDVRYKKITVRMLLNHSSGLMGTEYSNTFLFNDNDESSYKKLLTSLRDQRLKSEPGEFSVYCNDGFSLAQMIVEKISGKDFTTYIHEQFTEPLGLDSTKTPRDDFDLERLSKSYTQDGEELLKDSVNIIGAGGIYSTAEDLCRFMQIFGDNSTSLSEKSRKSMMENEAEKGIYPENNEGFMEFGLGWDNVKEFEFNRYGIQALCKGGDTLIYHGSVITIPKYNITVAVLSSGGASTYNELLGTNILKNVLKDKGIIDNILPDKKFEDYKQSEMPEEMINYSGLYMERSLSADIDISRDGKLKYSIPGNDGSAGEIFNYTSDGYFTNEDNTIKLKPVKEENGQVYLRVKQYIVIPGVAENIVDYYQMEKVSENQNTPESVQEAWKKRNGSEYLILNENYKSQMYINNALIYVVNYDEKNSGYVDIFKIVGKDDLETFLEIPCTGSRDMADVNFYEKDGIEYMKSQSSISINSKYIDHFGLENKSIEIGSDGYAKWFKIDKSDDKQITIDVPEKAAFAVYNDNYECINYSLVSKNNKVDLVNGKYIVFMGDKGSVFNTMCH
ncbi:MAG: serine hydrolase domain-containing protein [Clostridium sp.]